MYDYTTKSTDPDLMESIEDLNKEGKGKNVYILMAEGQLRASTTKYDITKHLESDDSIAKPGEDAEIRCLYGLILDVNALPYEIPEHILKTKELYLLVEVDHGFDVEALDDIEEITESISSLLRMNEDLTIESFAVVIGEEIPLAYALAKTGDSIPVFQVMGNS